MSTSLSCVVCGVKLNCDLDDVAYDLHILKCVNNAFDDDKSSLSLLQKTKNENEEEEDGGLSAAELKKRSIALMRVFLSALEAYQRGGTSSTNPLRTFLTQLSPSQLSNAVYQTTIQLQGLRVIIEQQEDPSFDTFVIRKKESSSYVLCNRVRREDDPFYVLEWDECLSPLPRDLLQAVMSFLPLTALEAVEAEAAATTVCYVSLVNTFWSATSLGDALWCDGLARRGMLPPEASSPSSSSESKLLPRVTLLLGQCRTLLVAVSRLVSCSFTVYVGTTVMDILIALGVPPTALPHIVLESDDMDVDLIERLRERKRKQGKGACLTGVDVLAPLVARVRVATLFTSEHAVLRIETPSQPGLLLAGGGELAEVLAAAAAAPPTPSQYMDPLSPSVGLAEGSAAPSVMSASSWAPAEVTTWAASSQQRWQTMAERTYTTVPTFLKHVALPP
eukprot:PhM_4_TR13696/c0_g1_i1/m.22951